MEKLGVRFVDNYITDSEQSYILDQINLIRNNSPKIIASYGDFNMDSMYFGKRYKKNALDFPEFLVSLSQKLMDDNFFIEQPFGVSINQYKKGQKIGAHIDKPISGPLVTILSLNSTATMLFKRKNQEDIIYELTPRSVIQLKDEIRNDWTHEILPVKDLRYSIVFRSLQ